MTNHLQGTGYTIFDEYRTVFGSESGVHQDGTTPTYRDIDGRLWAISGHSHMGEIAMFAGTNMRNMEKLYAIRTNFSTGRAGKAFDCHLYPEGILPRGSIWPFGLYICPGTHRFFAFFHNETGWMGDGTAYDSFGPCETPDLDSDFRHIGLMHSDDEGRTWSFDRWVVTAETVAFTNRYNPGAGSMTGQSGDSICLGAGDFSCYVEEDGDFIYLFYNMLSVNLKRRVCEAIDVYVARTRKRTDGVMGDFLKYYNGSFCEAGNLGRETPIVKSAWHAKVLRWRDRGIYLMSASGVTPNTWIDPVTGQFEIIRRHMEIRTSTDLIHWSEPIALYQDGRPFGSHYCSLYPDSDTEGTLASGNRFIVQLGGNGTDVMGYTLQFIDT